MRSRRTQVPPSGEDRRGRALGPLYAAGFVTAFGAHSVAANLGGYATGRHASLVELGVLLAVYEVGIATPLGFAALAEIAPPGRMGQTIGAAEVGRELGDAGGPLLLGALSIAGLAAGFAGLATIVFAAAAGTSRRSTHTRPGDRGENQTGNL
jgi:hypothetical protein